MILTQEGVFSNLHVSCSVANEVKQLVWRYLGDGRQVERVETGDLGL